MNLRFGHGFQPLRSTCFVGRGGKRSAALLLPLPEMDATRALPKFDGRFIARFGAQLLETARPEVWTLQR
jgi:hypothetical protein